MVTVITMHRTRKHGLLRYKVTKFVKLKSNYRNLRNRLKKLKKYYFYSQMDIMCTF